MKRPSSITLLFTSLSVLAAAGANAAAAERYDIDASHSGVVFGWNHFGFSNPARFDKIEGSVQLDKGDLTVHGVTKQVTLDARVNKIGLFEMPGFKAQAAGFDATTVIKRSDFGVAKYVPAVSDEIPVRITLDAKQAPAT